MPDVIAEAFVAIQPEPGTEARLARSLQSRLRPSMARVGRVVGLAFAGAATAAVGGLALVARTGLREVADAQRVQAQTAAAIKSTGGAARVTAAQVADYAAKLQAQTGVQDDVIQSGQNLILTFTKVQNRIGEGNDIFNRATKAALDLSARGFGSVESASLQLGKALNDPVKGVAALSRAGVTFTDQQKKQIKALVESNRVLDAQKIILREVEVQVGGSAEAAGNTLPGQFAKARRAFEGVAEAAVTALLPGLARVAKGLQPLIEKAAPFLARAFDAVADAVGSVAKAFQDPDITSTGLAGVFEGIGTALRNVYDFVTGTLVPGFVRVVAPAFDTVRDAVVDLVGAILPPLLDAVEIAGRFLGENLIPVLGGVAAAFVAVNVAQFVSQLQTMTTAAGGLGRSLVTSLGGPVGAVIVGVAALATGLVIAYRESETFRRAVDQAGRAVASVLAPAVRFVAEQVVPALRSAFERVAGAFRDNREGLEALGRALGLVARVVAGVLLVQLAVLARVAGTVLGVAVRVLGFALEGIVTVLGAVGTAIGPVARFVADLARAIADVLGGALRVAQTLFNALMAVLRPVAAVVEFLAKVAIFLTVLAFYPLLRVVGAVIDAFSRMRGEVGGKVAPVVDRLRDALGKAADVIRAVVAPVIERLRDVVRLGLLVAVEALEPVVRRVGQVMETVFGAAKAVFDLIVRGIVDGLNFIIDAINAIPDITIPGLGTFGIPDIARIGVPGANVDTGGTGSGSTVRDPDARRQAEVQAEAIRRALAGVQIVLDTGVVAGAVDARTAPRGR